MKYSEAQLEVWRIRDDLSGETASMSPEEVRRYFAKALEEFKAETGVALQVVDPTRPASLPSPGQ